MAGGSFARGFMATFPQSYAIEQQRKENAFEKMWNTWEKNEEHRNKARNESAKLESLAKNIASLNPELPEGAYTKVYDMLRSGMSEKQVVDLVQSGKWSVKPSEVPAGQVNTPDNVNPVDTQTAEVMGTGQAAQMAPTEPQGMLGNIISAGKDMLAGGLPNGEERRYNDSINRMAKQLGKSPEEIRSGLQSGTIQEVPEEVTRMSGNFTVVPQEVQIKNSGALDPNSPNYNPMASMDPDEVAKARVKVASDMKDAIDEVNTQKTLLRSAYRDVSSVISIVEQTNGGVLSDTVAGMAQWVSSLDQAFKAGRGLFTGNSSGNERVNSAYQQAQNIRESVVSGNSTVDMAINQTEQLIGFLENSDAGKNITDLATARSLLDMKSQLLAYKLASLYGQDGRAVAEGERKMFIQIAQAGDSTEKFYQNMSILLNGEASRVEDLRSKLAENAAVIGYKTGYGEEYPGLQAIMGSSVEDFIKEDPAALDTYNKLREYNNTNINQQPASAQQQTIPIEQAIEMYKQNPSEEMRQFFIEAYGKDPNGL